MPPKKPVSNTNPEEAKASIPDLKLHGNPNIWVCISKASSEEQGWMRSTKAMCVTGLGVLVQVSTEILGIPSEALTFIPGASILKNTDGTYELGLAPENTNTFQRGGTAKKEY